MPRLERCSHRFPPLIQAAPWRFTDRDNMVALGNYVLSEGEDPRIVLRTYFDPTLKSDAKFVDLTSRLPNSR